MKYCYECGQKLRMKELEHEGMIPFCDSCRKFRFPIFSTALSMVTPVSYTHLFRKGVCQLTCDCGHSPSKTAEEYEIPLKTLEKWITAYNKNPCCFDKSDDYYIEKHKEFAKPMIIYLQKK